MGRADPDGAPTFEALLERANQDPAVLAFWLSGSRGKRRPTEHSDYDVVMVVAEEAYRGIFRELGLASPSQ